MILPPNSYNPGLCRFQNRLLLSYRHHDRADWRTSLGMCELDNRLSPISCKPILPPDEHKDKSLEDARLFIHQDKLWLSFTISLWPATVFRSVVGFGELLEADASWTVNKCIIHTHGKNNFTSLEKNHLFFSSGETLYCLYLTDEKEQTILRLDGEKVVEVIKSKALPCPRGAPIHGGAICDGENGNLLHFYNTHTAHKDRSLDRYIVGVAELSGVSPFDVLRISKRPLLVGEEGACLDKNPRYKPNVCFVCGVIKEAGEYWVSFGVNDNNCAIAKFKPTQLHL